MGVWEEAERKGTGESKEGGALSKSLAHYLAHPTSTGSHSS